MSFLGIQNPWALMGPRGWEALDAAPSNQSAGDHIFGSMQPTRGLEDKYFSSPYATATANGPIGIGSNPSNPFAMAPRSGEYQPPSVG